MISLRLAVCVCVLFNIGIEAFQAISWWNQNMRSAATPPPPPPWWDRNIRAAAYSPFDSDDSSQVFDSDGCKPGYKIKLDGMSPGSCCNYNGIPMYCCHGPWNKRTVCS